MAKLSLWAPNALQIELETQGIRYVMQKGSCGWWFIDAPYITHDVEYAYFVDGKGPYPDPRSRWQPQGVHGPSCWVDHSLFSWQCKEFCAPPLASSIFYELHVGTFTPEGTFDAAIEKLGFLVELGITHVELMPVAEFSGSCGWGYDVVDLYAPHHSYGGPDGLKRFVDACHQMGLAVVLDVVYNHLGPEGNYLAKFGPYFTNKYTTLWGEAINYDGRESDEVRRFIIDNALMWIRDYHIDGLRIDAVHAIIDTSAIHILEEMRREVGALLIGESDLNDPRIIRSFDEGGYGLDAQWNEDFHHALHAVITGEKQGYYQDFHTLQDLKIVLTEGFLYGARYSWYRGRRHGRSARDISYERFISFLQNHDQVGNRPFGDRIGHQVSLDKLKLAASIALLSSYHPLIFQGEEWAASTPFLFFTDFQDSALAAAVKEGREKEFYYYGIQANELFDPQARDTFMRSKLNWDEQKRSPHKELLEWYKALIALRKSLPPSKLEVTFDERSRWLIIRRPSLVLVSSFSDKPQHITLELPKELKGVLFSDKEIELHKQTIFFPKCGVAIFARS